MVVYTVVCLYRLSLKYVKYPRTHLVVWRKVLNERRKRATRRGRWRIIVEKPTWQSCSFVTENPDDVVRNKPLTSCTTHPPLQTVLPLQAMNFLVVAAVNIKPTCVSFADGDNSYEGHYDVGDINRSAVANMEKKISRFSLDSRAY